RFTAVNLSAQRNTEVTPRLDLQLSPNHTLTLRYDFRLDIIRDAGVGSLNLVSRGYHADNRSQTVQLTETAVLNNSAVNETRFQYFHPATTLIANTPGTAIQVLSAFNAGGAQVGHTTNSQNSYELQNYTSVLRGRHAWR